MQDQEQQPDESKYKHGWDFNAKGLEIHPHAQAIKALLADFPKDDTSHGIVLCAHFVNPEYNHGANVEMVTCMYGDMTYIAQTLLGAAASSPDFTAMLIGVGQKLAVDKFKAVNAGVQEKFVAKQKDKPSLHLPPGFNGRNKEN